jgi:hypothetical protein
VPAGYSNFGFFALNQQDADKDDPLRAVQYWTVDGVFTNPCAMDEGAPSAGTSVEDLAAALAGQQLTSRARRLHNVIRIVRYGDRSV